MSDDFDETDNVDETAPPDLTADEKALIEEMPTLADVGQSRRTFLGHTIAGGLGLFALDLLDLERALAALPTSPEAAYASSAAENAVRVAPRRAPARGVHPGPRGVGRARARLVPRRRCEARRWSSTSSS